MRPRRIAFVLGLSLVPLANGVAATPIQAERVRQDAIITPAMLAADEGENINGPSLIRVPPWVSDPLGKYYLYFAHHAGKYIRMAYADRIEGPWTVYQPGAQPLTEQTAVLNHVASPDAVIDEDSHQIWLFYHGWSHERATLKRTNDDPDPEASQVTTVSVSSDGVHFRPLNVVVGPSYLRVFRHGDRWFGLNHTGELLACTKLGQPFTAVGQLIGDDIIAAVDPARLGEPGALPAAQRPKSGPLRYAMRHIAVDVAGDRLVIYFTCTGHRPERVLATVADLEGDPATWRAHGTYEVLAPVTPAEGADLPLAFSRGGISKKPVRELRDPGVCREGDAAWLLYSIAGERGLGLARLRYNFP